MDKKENTALKIPAVFNADSEIISTINSQEHGQLDPNNFLDFFKQNITPDMLLSDRAAQARLDCVLDRKFYQKLTSDSIVINQSKEERYLNPLPNLALKSKNGSTTYIHETIFELKEENGSQNYYFFDSGYPCEETPDYLRDKDIVPSGRFTERFPDEVRATIKKELDLSDDNIERMIYNFDPRLKDYRVLVDIPFNKPLNRVSQHGGFVERFNYRTGLWEIEDSLREYDAPIGKRIAGMALKITVAVISPGKQDNKKALR